MTNPNFTASISTNDLYYDLDTTVCLTDMLDGYDSDISALETAVNGLGNTYALANHTHDGYASDDDVTALQNALSTKSDSNHTHTGYATSSHTHSEYATQSALDALEAEVDEKAASTHTHADYALSSHSHDEYATVNHTHNYAASSHIHDDRYYTESEVDAKLAAKSDTSHNHDGDYDASGAAASALTSANAYTDSKIDALVGEGAAETLNTIGEISTAIEDNQDAIDLLNSAIGNKANATHQHAIADVANLQTSLDSKADVSHSHNDIYYTESEIDEKLSGKSDSGHIHDYAASSHEHSQYATVDNLSALETIVSGKAESSHTHDGRYYTESEIDSKLDGKADANHTHDYAPSVHTHSQYATVDALGELEETVSGKADSSHSHAIADVTNLQSTLDAKASSSHNHDSAYDAKGAASSALTSANAYTDEQIEALDYAASSHSHAISEVTNLQSSLDAKVPTSRKVNGKSLTADISLSASDVDAYSKTEIDSKVSTLNTAISGKEASGTAASAVSTHNTSTSAHSDIRDLIDGLTTRLNTLANSTDEDLDQMAEIVAYIKSNKSLIDSITTSKVNVSDIVNNLTTNVTGKPLSAAQGVAIKNLIDALQDEVDANESAISSHTGNGDIHVTASQKTNWNTAYTHSQAAHAPSNAQANQNAFSNVTVGDTTIAADTTTDTLTLVGSNVTLTPDATNDKVTIGITKANVTSALGYTPPTTNTTYSVVSTSADGLAPKRDGSTTKYLRADGTWAVPPDTNTTYSVATTSANGLMSASDKTKLNGVATGAEVNQNAFANVVVGDTTITADAKSDTLTLVAGSNVTLTPNATGDSITIAATDTNTVYTHPTSAGNKHIPAGGSSGQILRWSADGTAVWGADNNTTYSAATTSAAGLMSAADKTKLDGIATGANKYSLPTASSSTLGGVKTTSTVTSNSGYTACPIISGVPYYKDTNTTYSLSSFGVTATATELNKLDGCTATVTELNYVDGVTSNIQTQLNAKAASSHTHNYAGSSSAGGAATSANKLNTNAGDANTPVYFSSGVPVACTSLDLSTSGNAATATKLATARTINGTSFNGTGNITFGNLYPTAVPESADLDDYTQSGMYYCAANATVKTMTNCPTTNAFFMEVGRHAGTYQRVVEYVVSNPKVYFRNLYNGTWGSWYREYTTANKPTPSEIGAFSSSGGTISGETNVAGILRVQGQQAFYYASDTASQTIGTNNATGGTTICCGSSANVAINGANVKTPTVIPKTTGTYYCGNSNFRWKGIYSAAAVNVSSDERLKENVESVDIDEAVKLVNDIDVKSFNYIGNDDAQIGVIAQDIIAASPEMAEYLVEQDENGYYGVKTSDLVFPLIAAVQKLTKEVEELKAQLA